MLHNSLKFYKNILFSQGYLESLEKFQLTRFLKNVFHNLKLEITVKKLKGIYELLRLSDKDLIQTIFFLKKD